MKGWNSLALHLVLVAVAGAAGTLCRYGLTAAIFKLGGTRFPWSTVIVNLAGCLLFGIVWGLGEQRLLMHPSARAVLLVGFMGAFTTFSTFAFDSYVLINEARWALAWLNIAAQNVLGILAMMLGIMLVRWL